MAGHHNHGDDCCHGHPSVDPSDEMGVQYSLYTKINLDNVNCLNEVVDGSGKDVFKPWEDRLNFEKVNIFLPYSHVFNH